MGENEPARDQTTWRFLCYIADDTTLMFGCGTKVTPARGGEPVWDVTCYRATVAEQMGAEQMGAEQMSATP